MSDLGPLFLPPPPRCSAPRATSWTEKAPSNQKKLRALLADGAWHHMQELQDVAGWRYGARLWEIKRGEDGGPQLDIEKMAVLGRDDEWLYRATPAKEQKPQPALSTCPHCKGVGRVP